MAIWDAQEVEDNYARDKPGEATESRELRFAARRRNGYRAFFEHMPRMRNRDSRDRIYGSRLAFVTGDIHTFFAGQVTLSGRQPASRPPVATEFVGGSMTSKGIADSLARSDRERQAVADLTDSGVRANNPHIEYSNQERKGYGVLEARRDELRVEFRAPRSTTKRDSEVFTLQRFRVERGDPRVPVLGPPLGSVPS